MFIIKNKTKQNPPYFFLQPGATTSLLSVSKNLTTLSASYKCNHTVFALLCLAYFT